MQRSLSESVLSIFKDEQGGRSGQEVEVGQEVQILLGGQGQITYGLRAPLKVLTLTLKEMDSHCRVLSKGVT